MFLRISNTKLFTDGLPASGFAWIASNRNEPFMFDFSLSSPVESRDVLHQQISLSHFHCWIAIAEWHINFHIPHFDVQINGRDTFFTASLLKFFGVVVIAVPQAKTPTDFFTGELLVLTRCSKQPAHHRVDLRDSRHYRRRR